MMNLCMVVEVTQNRTPDRTMVMMPGTQPNTLGDDGMSADAMGVF